MSKQKRGAAPQPGARTPNARAFIVAGVIAAAIAGAVVFSIMQSEHANTPNVMGKSRAVAQKIIHARGLKPTFIGKPDGTQCRPGADPKVISQYPLGGQPKPKDHNMTLILDCNG
jgi:beta-lactam-binding protein with PASTA domain